MSVSLRNWVCVGELPILLLFFLSNFECVLIAYRQVLTKTMQIEKACIRLVTKWNFSLILFIALHGIGCICFGLWIYCVMNVTSIGRLTFLELLSLIFNSNGQHENFFSINWYNWDWIQVQVHEITFVRNQVLWPRANNQ